MSPRTNEGDRDFIACVERFNLLQAQRVASAEAEQQQASRVLFDREVKVYHVKSLKSFTKKEIADTWYSPRDLEDVTTDMRGTVKAVRRNARRSTKTGSAAAGTEVGRGGQQEGGGGEREEEMLCDRGLEYLRSAAEMERRKINKDCAFDAVLQEQLRQQAGDAPHDEERLRKASERGSLWSRSQAVLLAREDEREAKRIREEDKKREAQKIFAAEEQRKITRKHHRAALERALDSQGVSGGGGGGGGVKSGEMTNLRRAMELLESSSEQQGKEE